MQIFYVLFSVMWCGMFKCVIIEVILKTLHGCSRYMKVNTRITHDLEFCLIYFNSLPQVLAITRNMHTNSVALTALVF
jgi:hypothetical protein